MVNSEWIDECIHRQICILKLTYYMASLNKITLIDKKNWHQFKKKQKISYSLFY